MKNNKNFKLLQKNGYCIEKNILSKKQALMFAEQINFLEKKKIIHIINLNDGKLFTIPFYTYRI